MLHNDQRTLQTMENTISQMLTNGDYEMALPWKNYPPCLQNNKSPAHHRLKEDTRKGSYDIQQIQGFYGIYARRVHDLHLGPLNTYWYLPHHAVFHPQKPGKVCVVFDCSANYWGTLLNDKLLQGPDLTNSLVGVIRQFRPDPVAFMSDIEALFYQVHVRPTNCDALRFLWWLDGNLALQPEEYQMTVRLFGVASSLCPKTTREFDVDTIHTVKRNFYVDDCLKSVGSNEKAMASLSQSALLMVR